MMAVDNGFRMLGVEIERTQHKELRALAFYRETSLAAVVRQALATELAKARAAKEFKVKQEVAA
jgi:hypothetical protein